MGKAGNPARRAEQVAEERRISQVGDFKKRLGGVMELPSGLIVKLRNPGGMRVFLKDGLIPNSLMGMVKKAMETGQELNPTELLREDGGIDPELMNEMNALLDNVVVQCFVEPTVMPTPEDEADRNEDQLYADEIPDDDKMFVFQWVSGGTRDLEQFRLEHEQGVVALAKESIIRASSKQAGRAN